MKAADCLIVIFLSPIVMLELTAGDAVLPAWINGVVSAAAVGVALLLWRDTRDNPLGKRALRETRLREEGRVRGGRSEDRRGVCGHRRGHGEGGGQIRDLPHCHEVRRRGTVRPAAGDQAGGQRLDLRDLPTVRAKTIPEGPRASQTNGSTPGWSGSAPSWPPRRG